LKIGGRLATTAPGGGAQLISFFEMKKFLLYFQEKFAHILWGCNHWVRFMKLMSTISSISSRGVLPMIKIDDKNGPRAVKYAISAASLLGPDLMGIQIEDAFNYDQNIYALSNLIRSKRSFHDIESIIKLGVKDFKNKQNKTLEELVSSLNLAEKNIFNRTYAVETLDNE
jgi:hypothetical protein